MSRQAECAVTSELLWGPEKGRNSKAGHAWWMPVKFWLAVWLVLVTVVLLIWQPGDWASCRAASAGSILPSGSERPLTELAASIAARQLAVAVCVPDELSWGKSSSDWLTSRKSKSHCNCQSVSQSVSLSLCLSACPGAEPQIRV
jgi:hypothetical protein